jgi:quercetin dioxygenase-like cupin family protein
MNAELIEDPVLKCRYRFSPQGEVLGMELWAEPGADTPEHYHPPLEERFEVLEGEFTFTVEGEEQTAGPGDRLVVPPETKHKFANPGSGVARFRCEIEPALNMKMFFEESAALARAGKYTLLAGRAVPRGLSGVLEMADFNERFSHVNLLSSPPRLVQRIVLSPAARLQQRRLRQRAGD